MIKELAWWKGHVTSICKSDKYICVDATSCEGQQVTFEVEIHKLPFEDQQDLSIGCNFEVKIIVFEDDTSKVLFHIPPPYIWTKEDMEEASTRAEKWKTYFDRKE